jgi:hypothetical protein
MKPWHEGLTLIDPALFAAPLALDRVQHRQQRLHVRGVRYDRTAGMNAMFVAAVEFIDAARDYPIVFIDAGQGDEGQREVAPVAVLGLAPGENLMLNADGSWAARYVPALLRGYPLGLARTDGQGYVVVVDGKADALSVTEGERLFNDQGEPTPMLEERRKFLEQLENEAQRTRMLGRSLLELELLQPMRFDATLPDGRQLTVDGFLTVDEKRFGELAEATVSQLHKNGILAMIYAHRFSLGLMRGLVERRIARAPKAA